MVHELHFGVAFRFALMYVGYAGLKTSELARLVSCSLMDSTAITTKKYMHVTRLVDAAVFHEGR